MLTATRNGDNRLDIDFEGLLTAEMMLAVIDELEQKSQGIEDGLMMYRITNFEMPTAGAIGVELTHLPQLLRMVWRFKRCAVLCDTSWIRTVAEIEGKLMPGFTIKAFELNDVDAAEAWLTEGTAS